MTRPSQVHPSALTAKNARELRKTPTYAEKTLWEALRNRNFHGLKFRRQAPIGRFIVDFLCMNPPMIIEVDGGVHLTQVKEDAERTEAIQSEYKIPVLRFTNEDVLNNMKSVLQKIESHLQPEFL